jgi:hypothetical protein
MRQTLFDRRYVRLLLSSLLLAIECLWPGIARSQGAPDEVLSETERDALDASIERALAWMAKSQQRDGSFPTLPTGQPGVTSLCVMAFMAHGHVPGSEPYGTNVERALEFILGCQKENGLIALVGPRGPEITRAISGNIGTPAAYSHAISALTVSELYGMSTEHQAQDMEEVITKALAASLVMQRWPKETEADHGGWRYVNDFDTWDSDVSVTGWELMFLRSAHNAGFDVPKEAVNDAVAYIRRTFNKEVGTFEYIINDADTRSRGMAGAGILAMAHSGLHDEPEAKAAGEWLLKQSFAKYNVIETFGQAPYAHDRYHYGIFNSCQGMYQLGGRYWAEFFPPIVRVLLANQRPDGSWDPDSHMFDGPYGNAYTTALMVIALGAPNQLITIFQR